MTQPERSKAKVDGDEGFLSSKLKGFFQDRPAQPDGAIEPTIYRFILQHSLKDQSVLVVLTLVNFPLLYVTLELPKTIINHAINGKAFPQAIFGAELNRLPYLTVLCFAFLALVVVSGWLRFRVNVMKGQLGERMLRQLRYDLYLRTLRFPLAHFSRVSAGEIIAMITAELEPVAGFIGDSVALPIAQTGTLLTIFIFMFVQDPILGLAAISLYPIQGYLIPKLQRRIRQLGRRRVRRIRRLADGIGESIAARVDIRTNDYVPYQLAKISSELGEIYNIRYEIYRRKFFVKFLNNFLNQLTPFFFYLIGGYFVIDGHLSFGALVAILAAYKDLSAPWKELLDFYQDQQDVAIKYEQVVEQFEVPDMLDSSLLLDSSTRSMQFAGDVVVADVAWRDPDGATQLEGVDFRAPSDCWLAAIGPSNGGMFDLAMLLSRLMPPTTGRIEMGNVDINTVPMSVTGRHIGYCGPAPYLLSGTLKDTLLMGLRHSLPSPTVRQGARRYADAQTRGDEARSAAMPGLDSYADWIDYDQAGVRNPAELTHRLLEVLRRVDLDAEVYEFGLRGRLDLDRHPLEVVRGFVEARRRLRADLARSNLAGAIVSWDPAQYNASATVAENLLFGRPLGSTFQAGSLARQAYVREVLDRAGATDDLVLIGRRVAEMMLKMFGGQKDSRGLIDEDDPVLVDDLPAFRAIIARATIAEPTRLSPSDRERLLSLALMVNTADYRAELVTEMMQQRIVQARQLFAAGLPANLRSGVAVFDSEEYNPAVSIEENILFGKLAQDGGGSRDKVRHLIGEVLDELGLRDLVIEVGLEHPVGVGGSHLSLAQRQKASLARALLKRPNLLVLNEATTALDGASQMRVLDGLRQELVARSSGVFWNGPIAEFVHRFDQILVMRDGRVVAQGSADDLANPSSTLAKLSTIE